MLRDSCSSPARPSLCRLPTNTSAHSSMNRKPAKATRYEVDSVSNRKVAPATMPPTAHFMRRTVCR